MILRAFLAPITLFLISGCMATSGARQVEQKPTYEVVTIEQAAIEAVDSAPTEFKVSAMDDVTYWARALLFLENYTAKSSLTVESLQPSGTRYSNRQGREDRFLYQIEKYPTSLGYTYLIKCSPRFNRTAEAVRHGDRNARNLARFIQEGQLERTLLKQ